MKGRRKSFHDFIHDSMDIIIILIIIIIVGSIISWRLNLLFKKIETPILSESNNEILDEDSSRESVVPEDNLNETDKTEDEPDNINEATNESQIARNDSEENVEVEAKVQDTQNSDNKAPKTINIPNGSSTKAIGDILVNQGLISSSDSFVSTCESMNMSTKLKSGTYSITPGDSLENIITALTK